MTPFEGVLGRLFPPFVHGVVAPTGEGCETPHPEEHAVVAGAVEKRRREFLCGRACAHAALEAIGRDRGAIGVGPGRQPRWPPGAVGSISHAGGWSGAVAARAEDAWAIGFDIEELDPPLTADVERLVLTPADRSSGPPHHPLARHFGKIAYSVKESVYKCLFPATGWRLGFHDITVDVDLGAARAAARVGDRYRLAGGSPLALDVGVAVAHGYVLTGVCVAERRGPGRPVTG